MSELIQINNGQAVVSSRQVAEHFGKRHDHVMEVIKNLVPEIQGAKLFVETFFENRGKYYPEYLMNRDGFSLLAMGFTGKKALEWKLKYIQAFNAMEAKQVAPKAIPQTYAEALQLAATQAKELEDARPAVEFVERYVETDGLKTIRETAKRDVRARSI